MIGIGDPPEDVAVDEVVEPLGEDVAGDPEPGLEVVEAGHAEEGVPDDEQAPPVPHDVEALRDRASHVLEAGPLHNTSIGGCVIERTPPRLGSMGKLSQGTSR
jgi:hypothetical protein